MTTKKQIPDEFKKVIFEFLSDISNPKYILMQMLGVQILTIWMLKTLPKPIGYYSIFAIKLLRALEIKLSPLQNSISIGKLYFLNKLNVIIKQ